MSASILFLYLVWIVLFSVSKSDPHFILKTKQILKPILALKPVSSTIHSLFLFLTMIPPTFYFGIKKSICLIFFIVLQTTYKRHSHVYIYLCKFFYIRSNIQALPYVHIYEIQLK
jgi:hypothetical protein